MSSKMEEAQQLVHTITSYAEWTADEKNGLEFSFFMDGQTIPRYVELDVKGKEHDNAVQDHLPLDPTEYAYEDNFKVYDLDKEALGHLLAIVADHPAQAQDQGQEQEEPLVTLSRQTYSRIARGPVAPTASNDHLTSVVNFMRNRRSALSSQKQSPYYCSCMVTNGNKFIAQASGDACAFFYFEKALYPLLKTPNIELEDKDVDGNLLNSFDAYCDTDLGMAHSSKVIPVLENSVVILCNVPLFECLGQMDLIKIVHRCSYTENIAQALVAEAYGRHPDRSYQAASLYFLSAAESEALKSHIRDLLRRPHESLGQASTQETGSRQEAEPPSERPVISRVMSALPPGPPGPPEDRPKQDPFVSRSELLRSEETDRRSLIKKKELSSERSLAGQQDLVGKQGQSSQQGPSNLQGVKQPTGQGQEYLLDRSAKPAPQRPADRPLDRQPNRVLERPVDRLPGHPSDLSASHGQKDSFDWTLAMERSTGPLPKHPLERQEERSKDHAKESALERLKERPQERSLENPMEPPPERSKEHLSASPETRTHAQALSREDKTTGHPPRRIPPPPSRTSLPPTEDKLNPKSPLSVELPQRGDALLESDKYEPQSPSDRTREFSRSPFESRERGMGEETGGDPTKNIKDVLESTRINSETGQQTAEVVTDAPKDQAQDQGRASYGVRRKKKNSSSTSTSEQQIPSNYQTLRDQPSTNPELRSDTLASKSTPKQVTSSVDHNAAPSNGEMERTMENTDSNGISMRAYPNSQTDTPIDRQNTVPCTKEPQTVVKVDLSFPLGETGYDKYDMYHYEDGEVVTQSGHSILTAEDFIARQKALQEGGTTLQSGTGSPVQTGNDYGQGQADDWHDENPSVGMGRDYGRGQSSGPDRDRQVPSTVPGSGSYEDLQGSSPYNDDWHGSSEGDAYPNRGPNDRSYPDYDEEHRSLQRDPYGREGDPYGREGDPYGGGDDPYDRRDPYDRSDPYDRRDTYGELPNEPVSPNRYPSDGGGGKRSRTRPSSQSRASGSFMGNKAVRIAFYGIMATICVVCVIILVWLMKEKNQQDKDKDQRMGAEPSSSIERTVPTTEPTTAETTTEPTETETTEIETTTEDTEQTLAEAPYVYQAEAGDDVYSLCAQFYGSSAEKYAKVLREANPEVFANGDTPAPGASIIQPQMKSAPYYGKTQAEILAMPAPTKEEHEAGADGTQETGPDGLPVAENSESDTSERQTLPVNP